MKAVVQEQGMGCGLACVASVAGVSYETVLRLVERDLAHTRGFYCRELVAALCKLGFDYEHKKVTDSTKHFLRREGVIVFTACSTKYPTGHYLARTKRGWMNPWINYPYITPAKAGFSKRLPGKAQWIIFPT